MTEQFSIVIPSRSNEDLESFRWSFSSALRLGPDDIQLCLDKPASHQLTSVAYRLAKNFDSTVEVVEVARSPEWNFHQGHVRREGYLSAWHDKIFTYDIDTILFPRVLKGLDIVGQHDFAIVSFSKFLHIDSPSTFTRAVYYHMFRRWLSKKAGFTGIYWLYRPYYLDLMPERDIKSIVNGEDTLLIKNLEMQSRYKLMTMKDIGCYSLTRENEDIPWRQFQDGVWYGANRSFRGRGIVRFGLVMSKNVIWGHPHAINGIIWSKANPLSRQVVFAQKLNRADYGLLGKSLFKGYAGSGSGSEVA